MPTVNQVHVNRPLISFAVGYMQKQEDYVADKVFPIVPVKNKSDNYAVVPKEDWFRDEAAERAPATESAGSDYEVDLTPTYNARRYAFHKDISDEERSNTDAPIADVDRRATRFVMQKLLIKKEKLWVSKFFTTGVWTTELTGVNGAPAGATEFTKWDKSSSDPIKLIDDLRTTIAQLTAHRPNKLVLGPRAWIALKNNAAVLARLGDSERAIITLRVMAQLLELDEVLVPYGVENRAKKGAAADFQFIHGANALLVYTTDAPAMDEPTGGYTFSWTGLQGAGGSVVRIRKLPVPLKDADRIDGDMAFDQKVVAPDVGVFFNGVV